ncbi:redoxin domain-containing protein [Vibrio sp. Vb2880]|uniref:redoxin domain-containing protein n=1 Tax=Vibrio TaxID=662 RepID=UPI000200CB70|nr:MULTISPECIES: redoxin domain-containing protein [Vibrio]ADT87172.1 probable methylamine utilization protein mauD [Vibrio furnissii NCTC 11218]MBO0215238.1 redoxin domain-containing protein [Vibrio sp. Vb2880]MCG6214258.1 redoxin domain-containing protein [Vibrio furnissii]MCG6217163.1 redoxin domain-containing protein [Vibrio furnissii]MCG6228447.1 redoxin domain-containing protein [Vibrio furnissii]
MNTVLLFAVGFLAVLVALLFIAFIALSRQVGILFERISPVGAMINNNGPQLGETPKPMTLMSLNQGEITLGGAQAKSTLVLFVSPSCPICKVLLPLINSLQKAETRWLNVVLASDGDEAAQRALIAQHKLDAIPYVLSQELGVAYRVAKLPFSVLMDEQGQIVSKGLINSREQLESLFNAKESGFESLQDFSQKQTMTVNH